MIPDDICIRCEERPVSAADDYGEHCDECLKEVEEARNEAAYERSLGECFRGGEAAAFEREQMDVARRLK